MSKLSLLKSRFAPRRRLPKKKSENQGGGVLSKFFPVGSSGPSGTGGRAGSRAVSLFKAFFILLVVVILVLIGVGGFAVLKLKSLAPLAIEESDIVAEEWDGKDNLNILLLGVDKREQGLVFIDSIQLLYLQPQSKQINILSVDPDLSVIIEKEGEVLGEDIETIYNYRQLYNYYLSQDKLKGTDIAFKEFSFALEAELGVSIDRYLQVDKSHYQELFQPFFRLKVEATDGSKILDIDGQFEFFAKDTGETDVDMARRNETVKQYLLNLDNPYISFRYAMLVIQLDRLDEFLDTDLRGQELWQVYKFARGLNKYAITSDYTAEQQKYIYNGEKFIDKKLFDAKLRLLFFDQSIIEEQARLDVINGSVKPGLAAKTKRILNNHSFSIVRTDNSDEIFGRNTLYVLEPQKYPATVHKLQLFYPDLEIKLEEYPHRPTGDMVLVVV